MTKQQAKRVAWESIISLIEVNLSSGEGDLFVGLEHYADADRERIVRAMWACLENLRRI